jgi:hypothetical protein
MERRNSSRVHADRLFQIGRLELAYDLRDCSQKWAAAHRELWKDLFVQMAQEFVKRYNAGEISEGEGTSIIM